MIFKNCTRTGNKALGKEVLLCVFSGFIFYLSLDHVATMQLINCSTNYRGV